MSQEAIRLTTQEKAAMVEVFEKILSSYPGSRVWLFGSRVNSNALGGDIDLLISLGQAEQKPLQLKLKLLHHLQDALGERKIDILIEYPERTSSALHKIVKKEGVVLWQNPGKI